VVAAGWADDAFQLIFVRVGPPAASGQFVFAATITMLPIELTQANIVWALAFCGPASSRPMLATLARSSFENIYSSICCLRPRGLPACEHASRKRCSTDNRPAPMTPDLIPLAAMLGISLILTVVLIWRGSHGRFRRPYDWEMSAFIGLCAALGSAGGLFVLAAGIDNDTMIFLAMVAGFSLPWGVQRLRERSRQSRPQRPFPTSRMIVSPAISADWCSGAHRCARACRAILQIAARLFRSGSV